MQSVVVSSPGQSDTPYRTHSRLIALLLIFVSVPVAPASEPDAFAPTNWATQLDVLTQAIVPDAGPARPPFVPARYALWLDPPDGKNGEQALSRLTQQAAARQARLLEVWQQVKSTRRGRLSLSQQAKWKLVEFAMGECVLGEARAAAKRVGPAARFRFARVLMAECRFDLAVEELVALAGDSPGETSSTDVELRALALLVRHQAQRERLARHVTLMPLRFDLDDYLQQRASDPKLQHLIEGLRQTDSLARAADRENEGVEIVVSEEPVERQILDDDSFDEWPFDVFESEYPADTIPILRLKTRDLGSILQDVGRPYLAMNGHEFVLYPESLGWISGHRAVFTLHTVFHGPLRFHLYRFSDRTEWETLTAAQLKAREPDRSWTQRFLPLTKNNCVEPQDWQVVVKDLREGYYLLTVDARYAPMLGACKFCVNNVALYLRAGGNRAVVVAVDRRDGRPVPNVPVRLSVAGKPDLGRIIDRFEPEHTALFRAGFRGADASRCDPENNDFEAEPESSGANNVPQDPFTPAVSELGDLPSERRSRDDDPFGGDPSGAGTQDDDPDPFAGPGRDNGEAADETPPDIRHLIDEATDEEDRLADLRAARDAVLSPAAIHLRRAQAYAQGSEARERYPDFEQLHTLRTGSDGTATVPLDLARSTYRYSLRAERLPGETQAQGLSTVRLDYQHPKPAEDTRKALVWLDQPIHRPGSTVHFKGVVRRFDGIRVADHTPSENQQVQVAVRHDRSGEILWERHCEVSAVGTFHGAFDIPQLAPLGNYGFSVDDEPAAPHSPLVVDEFRVSTYRVKLTAPPGTHAGGDQVEAQVEVQYFTGKPAAGAEVELVLGRDGVDLKRLFAMTDSAGRACLAVPLPIVDRDRALTLRATVSDASGQTYTCGTYVSVAANPFQVKVSPSRFRVRHGERFDIEVLASGWDEQPIAGALVAAQGTRRAVTTDASGKATVRVEAADEGRSQQIGVTVIVGDKLVSAWSSKIWLQSQISDEERNEKPTAKPLSILFASFPSHVDAGEPIEFDLHVEGQAGQCGSVALFAENNRLLDAQCVPVKPGTHRLVVPTETDWAPSVRVFAVLLDGQRSLDVQQSCYLRPREKFLTLDISTDKSKYEPGAECVAVVRATESNGDVVPRAEISLGVVDEAIYELREDPTPDLQEYFFEYHLPYLCRGRFDRPAPAADTLWYWKGPRYAWGYVPQIGWLRGRSAMSRAGAGWDGACGASRRRSIPTRRDFRSTAHWVADLVTDEQGQARTTFRLPDNITDWRFTARGITADTRVGQIRVSRRCLLPLQVELALPRGLRQGDRIDLPVVLHNNADLSRQVRGVYRVAKGDEQPWSERFLAVMGDASFTIPVAPKATDPFTLFATIKDPKTGDADAIQRELAPLPAGYPIEQTYSGSLADAAEIRPDLGGKPTESGLELTIQREPGVAGAVQSAMDDLIQYPHGCVEQTMSRFMPALIAGDAMRRAGIDNPASARLPEVYDRSVAKLRDYQHRDGGWGWWKDDETNDFMTSYVLEGLAHCRRLDHPVPATMIERGREYLAGQLRDRSLTGRRPGSMRNVNLSVYAAHALATLYHQDPTLHEQGRNELAHTLKSVSSAGTDISPYDRILVADTWRLLGQPAQATTILSQLAEQVAVDPGDRRTIVTAAGVLALGAELEPRNPRWAALARHLVAARQGTSWGDTLTTSAAVRGLAAVMGASIQEPVPVVVHADGRRIGVLGGKNGETIDLRVEDAPTIRFEPAEPGSGDFYTVRLRGHLVAPPKNSLDAAVEIRSRIFGVHPDRRELSADENGCVKIPLGKTLRIQIEVDLKKPVSHTRLSVPRPCGVELIRAPKPSDGVVATEQRDDAFHFFIEHWDKGHQRLDFLVRAEVTGTISARLPELVPMYDNTPPTAVFGPKEWTVR